MPAGRHEHFPTGARNETVTAGFAAEAAPGIMAWRAIHGSMPNLLPDRVWLPLARVRCLTITFRRRVQCRRAVSV